MVKGDMDCKVTIGFELGIAWLSLIGRVECVMYCKGIGTMYVTEVLHVQCWCHVPFWIRLYKILRGLWS